MNPVSFREALKAWVRIACLSFGGPAGQIAVMHRILVDEKKWISENRFLHALSYCTLLPGPEAMQLVTYSGWMMFGVRGGLTAGLLFVLPGFLSILALSYLYIYYQNTFWLAGLFLGVKAAIIAVVLEAVLRISKKVLKNKMMLSISVASFIALFFFQIPFPLVVLCAGILGLVGTSIQPSLFLVMQTKDAAKDTPALFKEEPIHPQNAFVYVFKTLLIWGGIWFLPIAILLASLGSDHVLTQQSLFFSKAAMVTFGGAYSVLSYIAQEAVQNFGWLSAGEMMDGLGLAESTPGPLIQVVQFVGFLGAFRDAAPFSPWLTGLLASIIVTWVTFAPCFLWIFLGAPYIEKLRNIKALTGTLSSITAAVVGVISNLAIWFTLHTLFSEVQSAAWHGAKLWIPDWNTFQFFPALLGCLAGIAILRLKINLLWVLAGCGAAGVLFKLFV